MSSLILLIPVSVSLGLIGVLCFVWTIRTRQYDDLDGAAHRILTPDEPDRPLPGPEAEEEARRRR